MAAREAGTTPVAPGVIDTLGEGFAQINRVLWVILLPIVIDVCVWRAPRLSFAPLVDRWLALYARMTAELAGTSSAAFAPVDQQGLEQIRQLLGQLNLLGLLNGNPFYLGASPFVPWNLAKAWVPGIVPLVRVASSGVVEIAPALSVVGIAAGLSLIGLLAGCLFLCTIGAQIRVGQVSPSRVLGTTIRSSLSVLGFAALFVGAVIALSIPLALIIGLLALFAPGIAMLVYASIALTGLLVEFWMLVYLYFLVDAIVVSGHGPLRAAKSSLRVVRQSLWSALGFVSLTLFISLGMQLVWNLLAQQSWGLPVAILGNAYVSSGLIAASLLFYRNRAVVA
jgi:hypothetical protein